MATTQLRVGMIGVTGRGGMWRHWHDPAGRSLVVGGAGMRKLEDAGGHPPGRLAVRCGVSGTDDVIAEPLVAVELVIGFLVEV